MGRIGIAVWVGIGLAWGAARGQQRLPMRAPVIERPQAGSSAISPATAAALEDLARRAGVIFAGQVEAVQRRDEKGYVDVVFRVDEAVRGCARGSTYVAREWAGLWVGTAERYVVGERLLLLLAARGPSGMSAPVGGMAGRIPLVATGEPPLARGTGLGPPDIVAEDAREEAVDLRWVQALAVRGMPDGEASAHAAWRGPGSPVRILPMPVQPRLSAVLALLGGTNVR